MTQSLMESEAVTTLPHAAFKLLTILAMGARPPGLNPRKDRGSNGVQAITDKYARKFGFKSRDTVYRSLDELIQRGLIVKTRDGHRSKTHFALYGVAWLPITHREGEPLEVPEVANNAWMKWRVTAELPSDGRTQSRPMAGHDQSICRPIVSRLKPICRPTTGNTLRTLGTTSSADASGLAPVPDALSPSKSKTAILQKETV